MGCGQSKNQIGIASAPPKDTSAINGTPTKKAPTKRKTNKKINVKSTEDVSKTSDLEDEVDIPPPKDSRRKNKCVNKFVKTDSWVTGSRDSLCSASDGTDSRHGSATSKVSDHSADSGFDDNEYKNVITEFSDPDAVKQIEGGFETPRDLDLGVVGLQCPQRYSARDKERLEEQRVIASLREEGLITRPMSRAAGGLAFEVTTENTMGFFARDPFGARHALPPLKLAKLEKRKKRRRKLTEDDIKAKLEKAEERRKGAEQQRLEKIQSVTMKSNVQTALDSFAEMQKTKVEENSTKVDQATENREKRLKEMRDKLKAKQAHAEEVRLRKQLVPLDTNDETPPTVPSKFSEDAPIRVSTEAY